MKFLRIGKVGQEILILWQQRKLTVQKLKKFQRVI